MEYTVPTGSSGSGSSGSIAGSTGGTTGSNGSSGGSGTSSVVAASASYIGIDTSTRGSWKGVYGTDGFSLAGDVTSYPSYATVANAGYSLYTWTTSSSDVRALQEADSSTARIASCWYTQTDAAGASDTIDVNLTDGNSHQLGLYVIDWDGFSGGRAETIQLADAASGAVLDTESVSSFQAGGYLIWTVRGHVKITVINNVNGSNAVVSGLFFDPAGTSQCIPVESTTGISSSGSSGSIAVSTGSITAASGIGSTSVATSSVSYVGMDASTHGSWKGVYGTNGFSLAGDVTSYPSYATVANAGSSIYTWTTSSSDVRALQEADSSTARIASCWYTQTDAAGASYTIDVNLTDGNSHQLGLYVIDWDGFGGGRAETIQLSDATSGAVLDTESLSSFQAGGYLLWTVRGHVKITVINNVNGSNAVVSGLFFDPAATSQCVPVESTSGTSSSTVGSGSSGSGTSSVAAASVSYVGMDASTRGSWKGVYGTDGFSLAGDVTSYPSYATVANAGSSLYTWTTSSSDVRALQEADSSIARIASCWYTQTYAAGASYTIDVNLTDGNSHQLGLYVIDWDSFGGGRAETIQLSDAASGAVLDTESLSSFQAGGYLIWTVRGHVKINVINNVNGSNAVVSGLFFDPADTSQCIPVESTTGTSSSSRGPSGSIAVSTGSIITGSNGSSGSGTSSVAASSASYIGIDTSTRGSWKGVYGTDGFSLAGDVTSYPSYATVANAGYSLYTWTTSSSDVRALQEADSSTARIASCWYTQTDAAGASYTIDVNLTDGNSHQLGLYVVDWDGYGGGRAETIQLSDAASGAVLDTESVSSFQAGGYLIWTVRGHVKITVINNVNGSNAVVSGLFFDPAGTSTVVP